MGNLWIILAFLIPALFLAYFYSPRLYQRFFRKWGHLPLGFTAEKFNYLFTPILTIIAVCTTYSAFYVQSHFNTVQMSNLKKERAEKIVFEFINMHSRMVKDMCVTNLTSGNRSFHFIYYEYVSLRHILDEMLRQPEWNHLLARPRSKEEVTTLAFRSCYVGISQTSNGLLENWVKQRYGGVYDDLLQQFIREINELQRMNERRLFLTGETLGPDAPRVRLAMKNQLMERTRNMTEYFSSDQLFIFADGHMPALDCHMRLLRTILDQFNKLELSDDDKAYYLDLLRSQLSSHELLVISLYAFTEPDLTKWFTPGYLSKEVGYKNDLVRDVSSFLIQKRAIPDWPRYVSGSSAVIDSIMSFRKEEMMKDSSGYCTLLSSEN